MHEQIAACFLVPRPNSKPHSLRHHMRAARTAANESSEQKGTQSVVVEGLWVEIGYRTDAETRLLCVVL